MNQAINVKISALQAACMEMTRYMTKANETFNDFLTVVPGRAERWEVFLREKAATKEELVCEAFDKNTPLCAEKQKQR